MPHKHRREIAKADASFWDLPPGKQLQTRSQSQLNSKPANSKPRSSRKKPRTSDDTPRAFARLLQAYRPPRSGLDDGVRPSKKRRVEQRSQAATSNPSPPTTLTASAATTLHQSALPSQPQATQAALTVQPHEPLSHFSARVDAALPFSTIAKTSNRNNDPALRGIGKAKQTKTERKMQKMQKEWREEDRKLRERMMPEGEDREGAVDEEDVEGMGVDDEEGDTKKPRRKKASRRKTKVGDEDDPWKELESKKRQDLATKEKEGTRGLVGLHDVVQAPPKLRRASKQDPLSKVSAGKGGLKHQAELSQARKSVIEGYREMMRQKREALAA
ncbi:MAG: hypothetical protein OHK93_008762 [Ramalina farinacea]|uniref:Uncharacterized protein n=1 Tax=Ramalina farinacea TaxID=258253 RepID=A0AA43TVE7_9LECA|nr:hypothetical protein [Ramalina farinacea]